MTRLETAVYVVAARVVTRSLTVPVLTIAAVLVALNL